MHTTIGKTDKQTNHWTDIKAIKRFHKIIFICKFGKKVSTHCWIWTIVALSDLLLFLIITHLNQTHSLLYWSFVLETATILKKKKKQQPERTWSVISNKQAKTTIEICKMSKESWITFPVGAPLAKYIDTWMLGSVTKSNPNIPF